VRRPPNVRCTCTTGAAGCPRILSARLGSRPVRRPISGPSWSHQARRERSIWSWLQLQQTLASTRLASGAAYSDYRQLHRHLLACLDELFHAELIVALQLGVALMHTVSCVRTLSIDPRRLGPRLCMHRPRAAKVALRRPRSRERRCRHAPPSLVSTLRA